MNHSHKKPRLSKIIGLIAIICFLPSEPLSITVIVDPAIKYQEFEGWGTSLCWWAVLAGKWSESNRNKLIDAIVDSDTGLGYNCFRYNIGGGDQPGHSHLSEARAVQGFKKNENAEYNWTADQYQRNILLGIAARGKNLIFEAFSNSPPWWMTVSGCVSGNTNGADNLNSAYYTAFADYLATVIQHYKSSWDITFRTIEPFNEPSSGYWKINGGQEGCGFKSHQSKMIKELGKQLISKGLFATTQISSADETSLAQTVNSFKFYDDSTISYLSQINSHSYDGWQSRKAVDSLAKTHKKTLWQSESGPLGKGDDQSDITMWMSHVIIQDLRIMKPNAWIDWQVCDPVADWMTIELDHSKQNFKYTKRFYMHAAFSRFIRPGSQIISSNDTNSVAAMVPSTENLVIVLRNNANNNTSYTIDLSRCNKLGTFAEIYRFSLPGSLTRQEDIAVDSKKVSFTAPGHTITTCVIPGSATTTRIQYCESHRNRYDIIKSGNFFLQLQAAPGSYLEISLYNSLGRMLLKRQCIVNSFSEMINLNNYYLANGLYTVKIKLNNTVFSRNITFSR